MSIRPERMLVLAELSAGAGTAAEIAGRVGMLVALTEPVLELLAMQGLAESEEPEPPSPARYRITPEGYRLLAATDQL